MLETTGRRWANRLALQLVVWFGAFLPGDEASWANEPIQQPLLAQLLSQGVALTNSLRVPLPPVTLPDGVGKDEARDLLEPIFQRHGWDRFSRNSQVAPVELKLGSVSDAAGKRWGHTVSVWFVAHGRLDSLTDAEMLDELAGEIAGEEEVAELEKEITGGELSDDQLGRMGIERIQDPRWREVFVESRFPVLNRVEIAGVARIVSASTSESLVVAWELDPRFSQGETPVNHWQSIERTDLGEKELGPPQRYLGYGGYGKITSLSEPEGALFVECHVVFHEPEEWFAGSNALRAKIPLGIQENVRKFRRQLAQRESAPSN